MRSAGSGGWDHGQGTYQPGWEDYQDIPVHLQKDENGFGFKVIGGEEQGIPVAIGHVTPAGPAEGLLQIYDEIRSVNGEFKCLTSLQMSGDISFSDHKTDQILIKGCKFLHFVSIKLLPESTVT